MPVDFSAYKQWRLQHNYSVVETTSNGISINGTSTDAEGQNEAVTPTKSSANPPAPYPPTFSQIVDLISTGLPIPGIKDIPDTVLAGQETQPSTAKRKKPWEKAETEAMGGVQGGQRADGFHEGTL